MSTIAFDLEQLFQQTFGSRPYKVPADSLTADDQGTKYLVNRKSKLTADNVGSKLSEEYNNKEIWLPTRFTGLKIPDFDQGKVFLPYSVIRISGKKTIVKTPMAERQGTVKELYSTDDYSISIKGFLIDEEHRLWPGSQIRALKNLFELQNAVTLDNALTNLILEKDQKVVIESLEFPEVEGGRKHVRPFNMTLESDSIFTLEV